MALGSAEASLITQALTALAQAILAIRIFKFKIPIRGAISAFIFLFGLFLFAYSGVEYIGHNWFAFAAIIFVGFLLAILTRLIDLKGLVTILRSRESG